MEKTYEVKGMTCVICKANVEKDLNQIDGVFSAIVSLMDNEVLIDFDENKVNEIDLAKALKQDGYELVLNKNKKINEELIYIIISSILMIILMILSMVYMHKTMYYQLVLSLIIMLINNRYYYSGFRALYKLKPNMDSLVSLSSSISFIYSLYACFKIIKGGTYHLYFETSAMIPLIVSIGKYIENKNKKKTTKFIRGLSTLIPMQANKLVGKEIVITPIEEIKKNDIILIKAGESVPQDGIVKEGNSNIDESMITGESIPCFKTINSEVIGGTINLDGLLKVQITKNSTQTTLSKIVSLSKQATMIKLPIERLTDKISSYFVYIVLSISLLTFIIWIIYTKDLELSLNFALSVLVISCPCALGLATPSAISVACSTANKNGLLIKNPEILEIAYKLKTIILDKTGTLTNNNLQIVKEEQYDDEFIDVLSSLEKSSNHPIAKTINHKYRNSNIEFESIEEISGEGIIGTINNSKYYVGNQILLNKFSINIDFQIEYAKQNHYSYIGVGKDKKLLGIIYIADKIKESSKTAIEKLQNKNINLVIASGDNDIVVKDIANKLNISEYHSNIKPADKQELVKLKQIDGLVGMVGDGINDAIALSSADVSFTLSAGTDIANASSDISLLDNNLNDIPFLIDLSKKTISIIKQNMFWALFYNCLFIPVAAGVLYKPFNIALNPMIGAFTMSISSLIVISNALRIKKMKKE